MLLRSAFVKESFKVFLETKVGDLFHMDPAKAQLQVFEGIINLLMRN